MLFMFCLVWSIFVLITAAHSVYEDKQLDPIERFLWVVSWVMLALPFSYKISFGG